MAKNTQYYFDIDSIRESYKKSTINRIKYPHYKNKERIERHDVGNPQKLKVMTNERGKNPGDVADFWDIPTNPSSKNHYATYNTKLIDKPIIAGCPEGGIILDPFCGTGTTLIRAKQLMRNVIGIDGSKRFCKIAQEDLNKELSQERLF